MPPRASPRIAPGQSVGRRPVYHPRMPEGDTIRKLAGYLAPRREGRRLTGGHARQGGATDLTGRVILEVEPRGKHLFLGLDDARVLRTHLGMWGSWHHYPPGAPWQRPEREAGVVLATGDGVYVCFRPREVEVLRRQGVRARVLGARQGPDLLAPEPDLAAAAARARELLPPEAPAVDLLLDQRVAAGIGNVYKSEVLFLERLAPLTPLAALAAPDLERLFARARDLLRANTGGGPRVTRPGTDTGDRLWVYGRRARPCLRCATPVERALLGRDRRATYWCPRCQGP